MPIIVTRMFVFRVCLLSLLEMLALSVIVCRFAASAWQSMKTTMSLENCHVLIFSTKTVLISG